MDENITGNNQEEVVDPVRLVKKVRKSRKVRHGRRKQSLSRKLFRFFMTIFLLFLLVYISKMPQWYLPKRAYTSVNNAIIIENNNIIKPHKIYAFLKLHEVPNKPIYLMRTASLEKDIRKLKPVKDVFIRRYAFPARLQIILKERNPVITVAKSEKEPIAGAFAEDGVFMGHEYMPLSPKFKTIKVIANYGGNDSYTKWNLAKINEIIAIAHHIENYANEPIEYIDMRNPNNVFVRIKTVNIRIGKLDSDVYKRIERIPSILPQVKLISSKIQYLDISWEKVNYLKLK